MFNLFKYELTSRWLAIIGWGLGLSAFAAMYILIYPEFAGELEGIAGISIYKMMGIDMASFAGFIASVVVQIIPIVMGVYVILLSTGTLAGEEDNGTLELVVAMPLQRWQIVVMKVAAHMIVMFLIMVILGLGAALSLSIVSTTTEVDIQPLQLFVAMLGAYPLMLAVYGIGLFLGTVMPARRFAIVALVVIYIGSYVLNSIAMLVESLAGLKSLSLFGYLDVTSDVFTEGVNPANVAVLLLVFLGCVGLAIAFFQGRNITVGQWLWQRRHIPA